MSVSFASGMERMTTSTSRTASAAVTARAPLLSTSGSIVSGPRELATFTSWPMVGRRRARVAPLPTPSRPIFLMLPFGGGLRRCAVVQARRGSSPYCSGTPRWSRRVLPS